MIDQSDIGKPIWVSSSGHIEHIGTLKEIKNNVVYTSNGSSWFARFFYRSEEEAKKNAREWHADVIMKSLEKMRSLS